MPSASVSCLAIEPERRADAGGRGHGAEHGRRVEARLVHRLRHDQAQPANRFHADGNAEKRRGARKLLLLGGGKHSRHDDGARMHRPALEGVVEVLAMGGRAVDERRAGGAERLRVADGGRRAGVRPGGERGFDVVGAARDDAQADDIDQQPLAGLAHRRRQARRIQGRDALSERLERRIGVLIATINCSAGAGRR